MEELQLPEDCKIAFTKAFTTMVIDRIKELSTIYGNDENKILAALKEEYKNICEITELRQN
ncbi:MAG TPA: hypothetical protein GXZ35_04390 [Acholeplasmataceae bacterium]|nr:hypothetical protein [Acholeplasmataceae bacterium]